MKEHDFLTTFKEFDRKTDSFFYKTVFDLRGRGREPVKMDIS